MLLPSKAAFWDLGAYDFNYEFWEGGIQFITSCLFTMLQKLKGHTHTHTFWQAIHVSTHAERNRRKLWPYNEGHWSPGVEKLRQSYHAKDKGAEAKDCKFFVCFFFLQRQTIFHKTKGIVLWGLHAVSIRTQCSALQREWGTTPTFILPFLHQRILCLSMSLEPDPEHAIQTVCHLVLFFSK